MTRYSPPVVPVVEGHSYQKISKITGVPMNSTTSMADAALACLHQIPAKGQRIAPGEEGITPDAAQ